MLKVTPWFQEDEHAHAVEQVDFRIVMSREIPPYKIWQVAMTSISLDPLLLFHFRVHAKIWKTIMTGPALRCCSSVIVTVLAVRAAI